MKLTYILIILTITFNYGNGIKCHVCNSKENSLCLDPFNISSTETSSMATTLQECHPRGSDANNGNAKTLDVVEIIMKNLDSSGTSIANEQKDGTGTDSSSTVQPVSRIVCQKIVVFVGNETVTSRGCAPQYVDGVHPCDAVKMSSPESTTLLLRHCMTCHHDACNSGVGQSISLILILQVHLITVVLYYNSGILRR